MRPPLSSFGSGLQILRHRDALRGRWWPQRYSARPMGDSHRHLMITEEEWLSFMDDLQQTLDKFGVPQPEQNEIKAIVESTHGAIVVAPLQEGY
jgi:hemoglobin